MAAESAGDLVRVVALLGAAVVAVPLFKRIGLGSVLGYLAAGLAIGPYGLKVIGDPHAIIHLAEFGVVMFLFVIGLEMKPSHLWGLRRQIFGLGSMQVIISAILMTIVSTQFGVSWEVAFVSSAGFVLTSTAIVMQVLGERKELSTKRGQKMVSILLFEDLLIVPLLAVVTFLSPFESSQNSMPWWQSAGIAMFALAVLVVIGRFILNPVFRLLANAKAREVMTAAALFVVLGSALLMEEAGLSMAMGAFVAGVMLSESAFRHQLEADIEPFRGLLLGLFFLGVGMALDLKVVAENWQLILLGVLFMLTKGCCIYLVARLARSNHKTALERALLMAQGGEFAFVLFSAALSKGVIDETVNANMTAIVVLSMVLTPLILVIYEKYGAKEIAEEISPDEIDEQHPILIVGMGRFGQIVNDLLRLSGYATTIIDLNPKMIKGFNEYGIKSYFGDASRREFLIAAGLEHAEMLVVAIDNKEQTSAIVHFAREVNPNIKIIVRAYDRFHTFELYDAGANEVIRETFDSAVRTGRTALENLGMEPEVAKEIADYYFHGDRHEVRLMSQVYEPNTEFFKNPALQDIARECDQKMAADIQEILIRTKESDAEES
ncbi:potassium transporter [Rodentibacter trehalosifermentans]|uniref:Potassium transporter n=1 Tax=Rodentibacter trehalosifermentans TaxID=1908263 RepID=A0A1V3J7X2_9PAST|nr:monovalent cation:proton antiporter-2 (CPA2) family protein [Rodentibacter trehalosifermentans]OOF51450.1 potassium transporter [Rodentibacter trehalosifermentans]